VTPSSRTPAGIAYDRAGPRDDLPVVLLHAGIADRRMWDPIWSALAVERDVVRLDFRGFGESATRPRGMLSPVDDVLDTLAELGIDRSHLVGASFGAAVAVEAALNRPLQVASLLLSPPGGSLIAELTPDLRAFIETENAALARGDLGDAVEANLTWWVDGPRREAGDVDPTVRDLVRLMQRRAFEVTAGWDDIEKRELDPAALDRLTEIRVPTLVIVGSLDLEAIHDAARRVADGIAGARLLNWPDTAHLPSMERSDDFIALLRDWLAGWARPDTMKGPAGRPGGRDLRPAHDQGPIAGAADAAYGADRSGRLPFSR
jgi:3-oxoadipate enol-lactonase